MLGMSEFQDIRCGLLCNRTGEGRQFQRVEETQNSNERSLSSLIDKENNSKHYP